MINQSINIFKTYPGTEIKVSQDDDPSGNQEDAHRGGCIIHSNLFVRSRDSESPGPRAIHHRHSAWVHGYVEYEMHAYGIPVQMIPEYFENGTINQGG